MGVLLVVENYVELVQDTFIYYRTSISKANVKKKLQRSLT